MVQSQTEIECYQSILLDKDHPTRNPRKKRTNSPHDCECFSSYHHPPAPKLRPGGREGRDGRTMKGRTVLTSFLERFKNIHLRCERGDRCRSTCGCVGGFTASGGHNGSLGRLDSLAKECELLFVLASFSSFMLTKRVWIASSFGFSSFCRSAIKISIETKTVSACVRACVSE